MMKKIIASLKFAYIYFPLIFSFRHCFGDYKKPLWDTVLYVEKILRQQMNLLVDYFFIFLLFYFLLLHPKYDTLLYK